MFRPHARLAQQFLWFLTAFTAVLWLTQPQVHWLRLDHPLALSVGIVIVVISETWPLEVGRGSTISLASTGYLSVFLLAGTVETFWAILIGQLISWIRHFRGISSVSSAAVMLLGLYAGQSLAKLVSPNLVVRALVFALAFLILNHLLVNFYYWIRDGYQSRQEMFHALVWDMLAWLMGLPLVAIFVLLDRAYPHQVVIGLLGLLPYATVSLLLSVYYETRSAHQLNALTAEAADAITAAMDKAELVKNIQEAFLHVSGYTIFVLYLLDPVSGLLERQAYTYPTDQVPYPEVFVRGGESLTDWAIATRTAEFIRDARQHPSANPKPDDAYPLVSGFILPLMTDRKIWGFIVLGHNVPNRYSRHDFQTAKVLAGHAAMAYRKLLQEEAVQNSRRDPLLAEVYNFRYFRELLGERIAREPNHPMTLVFLDLDNFKMVNDRYGHMVGDRALARFAQMLHSELRPGDVMARYGGDEFVALLDSTNSAGAAAVLARIQRQFGEYEWPDVDVALGVSAGWAVYPEDGQTPDQLLNIADVRMYKNKLIRKGKFQDVASE
ncbi:sensor domain-containing diguanylate cyclase [Sulfobacillus harzensis]|uniref:GGDEF domain-containing protein n=1 Tax=Sulfobacillus harzensis TaxID=2729629 RepID=A0A7Y0L1F9_9FIRM|nr:sensor domain-containing diguanylate cyclase [Sulfobacillus harzensis]NMP20996.1 GGDEF domain-containing protein [Sulfobacillus harzensis]